MLDTGKIILILNKIFTQITNLFQWPFWIKILIKIKEFTLKNIKYELIEIILWQRWEQVFI